jgi:hypothetical protein
MRDFPHGSRGIPRQITNQRRASTLAMAISGLIRRESNTAAVGAGLAIHADRRPGMFSPQREFLVATVLSPGHLSEAAPPISRSLDDEETLTAVDLRSLPSGTELVVETRNTRYRVVMLDDGWEALVQGGRYFTQETTAGMLGCTFGGSLLKLGWIVKGLYMELSVCGKRIVTSRVQSISVSVNSATA